VSELTVLYLSLKEESASRLYFIMDWINFEMKLNDENLTVYNINNYRKS